MQISKPIKVKPQIQTLSTKRAIQSMNRKFQLEVCRIRGIPLKSEKKPSKTQLAMQST